MELSLAKIAKVIGGEITGDVNKKVSGAAPFDDATENDITYAINAKFIKRIDETCAGAVIVPLNCQKSKKNLVAVKNPYVAFARVLKFFYQPPKPETKISANAYIGKNFICGKDVSIAPFVVIQDNVNIGDRAVLHPGVVIGNDVIIGDDVEIYPNVSILERCVIGKRVIINAGTVIGSDGFGFAPDGKQYHKILQLGIVQIDDDVEIGACNTIDRATFGKTWICKGVKTDNLVQIAHNVTVGENSVVVSQVGISGSVTIGKNAILAGQAGIAGHLEIGDNVTIGPKAGIAKNIPDNLVVSGTPEMPHRLWLRVQRIMPKLPELNKKILEIEKRLKKIEEK